MRLVHVEDVPYKKPRTNHREGDIEFRCLMQGTPGGVQNFERRVVHVFRHAALVFSGCVGNARDGDAVCVVPQMRDGEEHHLLELAESLI